MKLSKLIEASGLQATDALPGIQTVDGKIVPRRFTLSALAAYFGLAGGGGGGTSFLFQCGDANGVASPSVTINCGGA